MIIETSRLVAKEFIMTEKEQPIINRCPTCKKPLKWSEDNPFRPFCSERCKIIDLGAWAEEEYKIPEEKKEE